MWRFSLLLAAFVGLVGLVILTDADPAGVEVASVATVFVDDEPTRAAQSEPAPAATSTSPPSTSSPPTSTSPPTLRTATIVMSGDMIPHSPVTRRARENAAGPGYDFGPMLAKVAPRISAADLALCHLETPLSADSSDVSGYPVFSAPRELAQAVADAGYDGCSAASNHSFDRRSTGVRETVQVLRETGLGVAGMATSAAADAIAAEYVVNDIRIAHLSFTYGLNGFELPRDAPYLVDVIDRDEILAEAAGARAAGADVVLLSLHWGNEYQHSITPDQESLATELLTSGEVDIIVGHHAHVVQPIDKIGGRYVVYGLGNFLTNQSANCCTAATQDGLIVTLRVDEAADGSFSVRPESFTPTWVDRGPYVIEPVPDSLADPTIGADRRATLEASMERTLAAIDTEHAALFGVEAPTPLS